MIAKVLHSFFGCRHPRYSFPITVKSSTRRSAAAALTGTYVVCLDCGKELAYDWQEMRIVDGVHARDLKLAASLAAKEEAA
jgi:hypothetical protein